MRTGSLYSAKEQQKTFYTGKVTKLSQEISTSGGNNIKITELIDLVDLKTETADRKHQIF